MDEQQLTSWHRLLGLTFKDMLTGQPASVDTEVDVSVLKQLLDILIIIKEEESLSCEMPDGFECMSRVNVISFKSHRETLDGEVIEELIHHAVAIRKIHSPNKQELLDASLFQSFAISVRSPEKFLVSLPQGFQARLVKPGVYDLPRYTGTECIRLIVIHELPMTPNNAILHLFSAREVAVRYAIEHFRLKSDETSTLVRKLITRYQKEGVDMPNNLDRIAKEFYEQGRREIGEEYLQSLPPEKLLELVPLEKRLEGVPTEKLLAAVPTEKRLEGVSAEEMIKAMSPEKLALLKQLMESIEPPPV